MAVCLFCPSGDHDVGRIGGTGGEIPQTCQPLAGGYLSASLCSRKEKISINVRKLSVFISKLMFARNILEIFPV